MINNSKVSQSLCWRCIKANATPLGCSWFREGKMPKGVEFVRMQYTWYGSYNGVKRNTGIGVSYSIRSCPQFEEETAENRAKLSDYRRKRNLQINNYGVINFKIKE